MYIQNYGGQGPTRIQGLTIQHGNSSTGGAVGGGINVLAGDLILKQPLDVEVPDYPPDEVPS